jgi:2-methylisocitrate lyase-like PEP mutase family enzyme
VHTDTDWAPDPRIETPSNRLRALHRSVLVLPNAWDAASAAVIARAGATAIGTTSAGIAWSRGLPDGHRIDRNTMIDAVHRIVAAVDIPVTADIENGYGPNASDVAETVTGVVRAGAAGINLEDSSGADRPLHSAVEQAARIRTARHAARQSGDAEFVINARTDVYFTHARHFTDPYAEVLARAEAYADAGADCLFVPGLLDLAVLERLAGTVPLPINAMTGPGGPSVRQLADAGVRRISLGPALLLATHAATHCAATEFLTHGTYDTFVDPAAIVSAVIRR